MTTVEVLRAARALIDTPEKWGQGDGLCDRGLRCAAIAVWDAQGIVAGSTLAHRALAQAMGLDAAYSCGVIFDFNDSHTHAEVMAAFDRAIANEEAKAQEFTVEPFPVFA